MTNLFDYLKWRGDLAFSQAPLTSVDLLIFSEIVHAPLERLLKDGDESYKGKTLLQLLPEVYPMPVKGKEYNLLSSRSDIFYMMKEYRRFADVKLMKFSSHFEPEHTKQFAAAEFAIGKTAIIAFRGTDATVTGWREDFLMSFESPIPAQTDALSFMDNIPDCYDEVYVCGHSKGGNLAMYASALTKKQDMIKAVFSFDGPGLDQSVLDTDGWKNILSRAHLIVPESSIIGLLMGYIKNHRTIESDSMSIMQHNPFYWHVFGNDFIDAQGSTLSSKVTDNAIHTFLEKCTREQRKTIVDAIFDMIEATGAVKTKDIVSCAAKHPAQIKAVYNKLSPQDKDAIKELGKILFKAYGFSLKMILGKEKSAE